ncbi:MAG: NF038122 family metalloprotease [Sphingomonadaceae bacterium]|nr:NF038122 family metalloprotease [Sphingomonadaceae bacterium]
MDRYLVAAALCGASTAAFAVPAEIGHIHGPGCGHQTVSFEGEAQFGALVADSGSNYTLTRDPVPPRLGSGLQFNLLFLGTGFSSGDGPLARAAFQRAASVWSSYLRDPVTITLELQFNPLAPNVLGSTGSTTNQASYSTIRQALAADATSRFDRTAVANLETGNAISFVSNEPPSAGPINAATKFFDNNNTTDNLNIQVNTANVKALGGIPTYTAANVNRSDGSITFSSNFSWDYDPDDGIDTGKFDFVGVAVHEIGHALGFRSGVDLADSNALPYVSGAGRRGLNNLAWVTTHDLFRFNNTFDGTWLRDMSIGGRSEATSPCYTLDRGQTCIAKLSTGANSTSATLADANRADGRQASHWKDDSATGTYLGVMDPTASGPNGTYPRQVVTYNDLIAFDAMGYDLFYAVPAPAGVALFGLGALALGVRRRRA